MPKRIAALPKDKKGRPVPFFVAAPKDASADYDFRVVDARCLGVCWSESLCWVCGQKMGKHRAFVLGPMCAVNRINSEPPSHVDCAQYSVKVCPFLSQPRMERREGGLPDEVSEPAGIAIYHNPGAMAVWVTKDYILFPDGRGGFLFQVGPPERVEWWALGQPANRYQVMAALEKGMPKLRELARSDQDSRDIEQRYQDLLPLLPE